MISAWKYLKEIPQRMKVFFEMPSAFVASEQSRCVIWIRADKKASTNLVLQLLMPFLGLTAP